MDGPLRALDVYLNARETGDEIRKLKANKDSTLKDYTEQGAATGGLIGFGFAQAAGLLGAVICAPVSEKFEIIHN